MPSLARFFGRTASEGAAFAMGHAVSPALSPAIRELVNEAWSQFPTHPLPLELAIQVAAEDRTLEDFMRSEGEKQGVSNARMNQALHAVRGGPAVLMGLELWRRGLLNEAGFDRVLWEARLEEIFHEPIKSLRNVLLSPADLAMARQQGFVTADRQRNESELQGVTNERADILFEISGLPPGIQPAVEALHRGFIGEGEFAQIVREGHTKTKYTDLLLQLARPLLSAATTVNLFLRGWIDRDTYHDRMSNYGYSAGQADDWYDASGRPAAPVQMQTAWARGIQGPDGRPMDKAQFLKGIRESDIRPEWGEMLWGIRHAYPSLFQLRGAVQAGGITRARALEILHFQRYEDQDATSIVDSWLRGSGTTAKGLTASDLTAEYEGLFLTRASFVAGLRELGYDDTDANGKADAVDAKRTRTARNSLISRIHNQYVAHKISRAKAVEALQRANVPARVRDLLLPDWDLERELTADSLTPAQIKKAWKQAALSRAVAIDRLEWKGYDEPDANIYLDQ